MNAIVHTAPANAYTGLDRFLRTRLLRQLDALEGRAVELHDALGSECVGRGDAPPPSAPMTPPMPSAARKMPMTRPISAGGMIR